MRASRPGAAGGWWWIGPALATAMIVVVAATTLVIGGDRLPDKHTTGVGVLTVIGLILLVTPRRSDA